MRVPAEHSRPFAYDTYGALDTGERYMHDELLPGERLGPPRSRSGRKAMLSLLTILLIGFGGGWVMLGPPDTWPVRAWSDWVVAQVSAVTAALERKTPPMQRASSETVPPLNPDLNRPLSHDLPAPVAPASPPLAKIMSPSAPLDPPKAAPLTTGSLPPAQDRQQLEPLPPLAVDRADPLQVRAEAVGLHPGLSRVLLARLSEADYRNAGVAIKTAIAETPDSAVHVWPRQRKPELAVFKVHFVPGAASDCRRYVVSVAKDGWMTTALPMERCGAQNRQALRK